MTPSVRASRKRRLVLGLADRTYYFLPDDIDWVQAAGNYSRIHAHGQTFVVRGVLRFLEQQLASFHFVRIGRSYIVNMAKVFEIRRVDRKRHVVVLTTGARLRISDVRKRALDELMAWHELDEGGP